MSVIHHTMGSLATFVKLLRPEIIDSNRVAILKDMDGHHAMIYQSEHRLALDFQEGYCPVVYPAMKYEYIGLFAVKEGLDMVNPK